MRPLNITYIKSFITKFEKDTGARVTLDELFNSGTIAGIKYRKDDVHINISIKNSVLAKYEVGIRCEAANVNIYYLTDNLNDLVQACDLLIYTAVKQNSTLNLKAKIKSNHWGIRLVTVERQDGYRANLYISGALRLLILAKLVNLEGAAIKLDDKSHKIKVNYSKDVLNYDKIQKEGSWSKYDIGFQHVVQYPNGNDYIHPSLKWQKGKLF